MRVAAFLFCAYAAVAAEPRGVVIEPVVNMYSKATLDADVVSQARYATTVKIAAEEDGWLRIQTPDEYFGWVPARALRRYRSEEAVYGAAGRTATVWSNYAHLYRENSVTRHAPLVTVPFETRLAVLRELPEDNRRWLAVSLPDGREAFVQRGDVRFNPPALTVPELIELAQRFLGLPYTWGGTSSYGYDCSGFTQMLCRRGGVEIPRDAAPQALWSGMQKVERAALEPGDLLYFGKTVEKATHTGFYMGGGRFIHSTTNTRPVIQISRLEDEPWTELLVGARRWRKH